MRKNKKKYPFLVFVIIIVILLVAAFYFRDYISKIIPPNEPPVPHKKNLSECIREKNITLYGLRGSKVTEEQIEEIEELFNYINFIDCSKMKDECFSVPITPAWKVDENIFYNLFSRGTLIKIAGCDDL